MDKTMYFNILQDVMLPHSTKNMSLKWTFQQDNDPKHTSKLSKQWFTSEGIEDFVDWFSSVLLAVMGFYIIFYHLGIGPIPVLIGAELFEVAPRSVAMSLGGFSATAFNFILSITFPTLQNLCGGYVFIIFSSMCCLLFLFTKFYLPETRGRDPIETSQLVANGFKSKVHAN